MHTLLALRKYAIPSCPSVSVILQHVSIHLSDSTLFANLSEQRCELVVHLEGMKKTF